MPDRKLTGVAIVLAVVVLGGCLGGAPTSSDAGTTTPSDTTNQSIEEGDDATYPSLDEAPDPIANVSGQRISESILASMAATDTYRMNGTVKRTQTYPTGRIEASTISNTTVDRADRTLRNVENTSGHMIAMETRTIVHNGTYYRYVDNQRDDAPASWNRSALRDGEFDRLDPLERQRLLLENATVTVTNTTDTGTSTAYAVHVDVNESAYMEIYDRQVGGKQLNVTGVAYRYVVDAESGRLLEMTGLLRSHTGSAETRVRLLERYDFTVSDYDEPVSIEVPANATDPN